MLDVLELFPESLRRAIVGVRPIMGFDASMDPGLIESGDLLIDMVIRNWMAQAGASHVASLDARGQESLLVLSRLAFVVRNLPVAAGACPDAIYDGPGQAGYNALCRHLSDLLDRAYELQPEVFETDVGWSVVGSYTVRSLSAVLSSAKVTPDFSRLRPELADLLRSQVLQDAQRHPEADKAFRLLLEVARGGSHHRDGVLRFLASSVSSLTGLAHMAASCQKQFNGNRLPTGNTVSVDLPMACTRRAARELFSMVATSDGILPPEPAVAPAAADLAEEGISPVTEAVVMSGIHGAHLGLPTDGWGETLDHAVSIDRALAPDCLSRPDRKALAVARTMEIIFADSNFWKLASSSGLDVCHGADLACSTKVENIFLAADADLERRYDTTTLATLLRHMGPEVPARYEARLKEQVMRSRIDQSLDVETSTRRRARGVVL